MIDVGLTHVIVKRLNRYYCSRSKPHGKVDLTFRGTRMSYNNTYRFGTSLVTLPLLVLGIGPFFAPRLLSNLSEKSPQSALFFILCWMGVLALGCLTPLESFREFVVVTDDGLIRSNLFGKTSRMEWKDISSFSFKTGGTEINFLTSAGTKLKTSLCYDGWADLLEISARHLNPAVQSQLYAAVQKARPPSRQLKVDS